MKAARQKRVILWTAILSTAVLLAVSQAAEAQSDKKPDLVERGRQIFFNETFDGNGRTCGTCHRAEDNFGISPAFIATLPPDDPLFVAENIPALRQNFENPVLMRQFGVILENQDCNLVEAPEECVLEENFNMRGVPHVLALRTSIGTEDEPRTGWSGDGSPGDGSLRSFAIGAVVQHFPLRTDRVAGVDFRLPTEDELDALEAFQLSLGRQREIELPLLLRGVVATRGQAIFMDNQLGKCNLCHTNAGANNGAGVNRNFNTGVEDLPDQPLDLDPGQLVPPDDGFGVPGDGTFNTPVLVESADTGPFFHNNAIETIEGAVAFYSGDAFNNSDAAQNLVGPINLDATQTVEVAAFLRVINALENIRVSIDLLETRRRRDREQAGFETEDAILVLVGGGVHPEAVAHLEDALELIERSRGRGHGLARRAIRTLKRARAELVVVGPHDAALTTPGDVQ